MKALVNPKHVVAAIDGDHVEKATIVWTSEGSVWRLTNIAMSASDALSTTEPLIAEYAGP